MPTYSYTYGVGRKVSHNEAANDPAQRERKDQPASPVDNLILDDRGKRRASAPRTERGQAKRRGYYA